LSDEIDIPDECYHSKPYFKERPDSALVKHIKAFIKETGNPHMWHGHTHTKPPKGARIVYLAEFDLPKKLHKSPHLFAPCPCCSPTHPKYVRNGKIGWFPDEGIIRIIGPDCFAALDKEGHFKAVAQLRAEQQIEKDTIRTSQRCPMQYGRSSEPCRRFKRSMTFVTRFDAAFLTPSR
jgi:hypothetical protein